MRAVLAIVTLVIGLGVARPAHAGRAALVSTGDDISHLRDLAHGELASVGLDTVDLGYGPLALGYHYQRFGVFFLDVWRWSGEPVVYRGTRFRVLTDDQLETLRGRVPLAYHLPPGLMIVLALLELAVVTRGRMKQWLVVAIGQILIASSIASYLGGLEVSFLVPLALGLFHLFAVWRTRRALAGPARAARAAADPGQLHHAVVLPIPPPNVETDPFRAPPQVHIVPIQHAAIAPTPIAIDANADKPKLLD